MEMPSKGVGTMLRSFRFLLQFSWINLGAVLGFAAVVVAGSFATGVGHGAENLFATYYGAFPLVILFVLFIYAFALCTSNLNLGLSFGARRKDFFWALQGIILVYAGVGWLVHLAMSWVPKLGNWTETGRWTLIWSFGGDAVWVFPAICVTMMVLGCLGGLVFCKSKLWGTAIIILAVFLLMVGTILLFVMADLDAWAFLMGSMWHGLWGSLPAILTIVMLAALVGSEAAIWRWIHRFTVR